MTTAPPIDQAFIAAVRTCAGWQRLTPRELEVLERAVVHGERRSQISESLAVVVGTYDAHWQHIITKLGYSGAHHAAGRWMEHDLLIAYGRALERADLTRSEAA